MSQVAFFRNLNQGQRNSPSSAQLLEAFAGAEPRLVRGNGTVLFTGAPAVLAVAVAYLVEHTGWDDVAFAREAGWLAGLLDRIDEPEGRTELTLFDEGRQLVLPVAGARCAVIRAGAGYAVTVNATEGISDATPTVEKVLGVRATSRGLSTIRLGLAR